MIQWAYYPKSDRATPLALVVVQAFKNGLASIDSAQNTLGSNAVLALVANDLQNAGFIVETGKKADQKISVPVLFGLNGHIDKYFDADAYHEGQGFVLEVEAGRAVSNNQFLKDLFQACMMNDVFYLAIGVRNLYQGNKDFESIVRFFDTLYASNRVALPLKGILIIGY